MNLQNAGRKRKLNLIDSDSLVSKKKQKKNIEVNIWEDFNNFDPFISINEEDSTGKNWISASKIKNYLLKEPLLDWLEIYSNNRTSQMSTSSTCKKEKNYQYDITINNKDNQNLLLEKGINFEYELIESLKKKHPNCVKKVINKGDILNKEKSQITEKLMKEGTPIIEQAALYNEKNKTFGIADILIRSDWINKLFEREILNEKEVSISAPNLKSQYHYRVIEIKWTNIAFCANGLNIRNNQRMPAYKGQVAIYNSAMGVIQGFIPNKGYILGKSWSMTNNTKEKGFNCFTRLGEIDFENFDNKIIKETIEAIKWIRKLRYNGHLWKLNEKEVTDSEGKNNITYPTVPELYPNMCNKFDNHFSNIKKNLSHSMKEITELWMVGVKHRQNAFKKGIMNWMDPRCHSITLGIKGKKIAPIVDKILHINRNSESLILPTKIKNNFLNWQFVTKNDIYIDFESINECLYIDEMNLENSKSENQMVFMIGIGFISDNKWNYKCFVANDPTINEEKRIFDEFFDFVKYNFDLNEKIKLYHWSFAEPTMFKNSNKRHLFKWNTWNNIINWVDMCKIFIDEPIVIKGSMKFGLKEIAKNMFKLKMINSFWPETGPDNGLSAMIDAIKYYKNKEDPLNKNLLHNIIIYNEIDCKIVYEIVNYLRLNNC